MNCSTSSTMAGGRTSPAPVSYTHLVHLTYVVSASSLGLVRLGGLGKDQHALGLAGAVGQNDGAADLLVSVAGVDTQFHVELHEMCIRDSIKITLRCSECKQRNYNTMKNKKNKMCIRDSSPACLPAGT